MCQKVFSTTGGTLKKAVATIDLLRYNPFVGFLSKFIARIILNAVALYVAKTYLSGFLLIGGIEALLIGGLVLAFLNAFVRPVLRLVSSPLIFLTFGLFNIVIHVVILLIADYTLTQLTITSVSSLFFASIVVALANTFF